MAFPVPDFEVSVTLTPMNSKDSKNTFKAYVNSSKVKVADSKMVRADAEGLALIMRLINDNVEKSERVN